MSAYDPKRTFGCRTCLDPHKDTGAAPEGGPSNQVVLGALCGLGRSEFFGSQPSAFHACLDFLKCYIPRSVWRAVLRLHIDAEWREAAIVSRTQALFRDELRGGYQIVANLLRGLNARVLRIDNSDKANLSDTIGIGTAMLTNELIDAFFVLFARQLHQEIASIHLEHAGQEFGIVHVGAVGRVAIAAWACVDANISALFRRESVEHSIVQRDEFSEHVSTGPRIIRIVAASEPSFGKIN